MLPPRAVFTSHKTQQLYQILQSLQEEPVSFENLQEQQKFASGTDKHAPKEKKGKKKKVETKNNTFLTPKFLKTDRWTVESSESRGSKSKSRCKYHPLTTRNNPSSNVKNLFFKSNIFTPRSNNNNISIQDQSLSIDSEMIHELNQSNQTRRTARKSNSKVKSRLFTKEKLESMRKIIEFVKIQKKSQSKAYSNFNLPLLSRCVKQRNWVQVTNDLGSANFLWVDYADYLLFQRMRIDQIKNATTSQVKAQSFLVNYLSIDTAKLLLEFTTISSGKYIPKTIDLQQYLKDKNFKILIQYLEKFENINYWIIKPIERDNFNNSHICANSSQIKQQLKNLLKNSSKSDCIIQEYISNPLLYHKRKFVIKSFLLVTNIEKVIKGYLYDEVHIQTSALQYKLDSGNLCIHFTGNEIQKQGKHYGKYEENNMINEAEFNRYLETIKKKQNNHQIDYKTEIKDISFELVRIISKKIKNYYEYLHYFQLFQLDFLMYSDMRTVLIGINGEANLQSKHMARQVERLIENVLKLTLDMQIPPPISYFAKNDNRLVNNFELLYDSRIENQKDEGLEAK